MSLEVGGIHHVTCIAGHPQENVDFYAGTLGLRMVKRSVNQDDPGTYHLFYADGGAHAGSDITFFPWPAMGPGTRGTGMANEVAFAVPPGSLPWWRERLERQGFGAQDEEARFGERVMTLTDPHGLPLALVESARALERPFDAWKRSEVPAERQIRGIHAVRVAESNADPTSEFAQKTLGMKRVGHEEGWTRFEGRDAWCGHLDVRTAPELPRGEWGVGTVHHVAWRVRNESEQVDLRALVQRAGLRPTQVIDRFWFTSVYFREPGGVLFELATDPPGFAIDEPIEQLGQELKLPPWLEPKRKEIEHALPPIELPKPVPQKEASA